VPEIYFLEGPVGAGKSTVALQLQDEKGAVHLCLDDWMNVLYSSDRPDGDVVAWYTERKKRCIGQIWKIAVAILNAGSSVILELGLIQRSDREVFFDEIGPLGYVVYLYVIDAPKNVRKERVRSRNREQGPTFSMVVSDEVFEFANNLWEPLTEDEASLFGFRYRAKQS